MVSTFFLRTFWRVVNVSSSSGTFLGAGRLFSMLLPRLHRLAMFSGVFSQVLMLLSVGEAVTAAGGLTGGPCLPGCFIGGPARWCGSIGGGCIRGFTGGPTWTGGFIGGPKLVIG